MARGQKKKLGTKIGNIALRGRVMAWFVSLRRTGSYLNSALYFLDNPIAGKIHATTGANACINSAIMHFLSIYLKGYGVGKLVRNNAEVTQLYWPKIIESALSPEELTGFENLRQKIKSIRDNHLAHVNASEHHVLQSGDTVMMGVTITWARSEIVFWSHCVEKLANATIKFHESIEIHESERAPLIAVAGPIRRVHKGNLN